MVNENEFLLHALMMGVFITFIYDMFRIFRRVIPHRDFFVSLEDLCFWIYCGGEVFLLMYHESNGTLRWFAVLGALTGMMLYRKLVSPWFVKYVAMFIKKGMEIITGTLRWICSPLIILRKKAGIRAGRLKAGTGCLLRRIGRILKNKLTYFLKVLKITVKTK